MGDEACELSVYELPYDFKLYHFKKIEHRTKREILTYYFPREGLKKM